MSRRQAENHTHPEPGPNAGQSLEHGMSNPFDTYEIGNFVRQRGGSLADAYAAGMEHAAAAGVMETVDLAQAGHNAEHGWLSDEQEAQPVAIVAPAAERERAIRHTGR